MPTPATDPISRDRLGEIWQHLTDPDADPAGVPEYVATGTDERGEYLELNDGTRMRRSSRGGWYPPGWSKAGRRRGFDRPRNDDEARELSEDIALAEILRDIPGDDDAP